MLITAADGHQPDAATVTLTRESAHYDVILPGGFGISGTVYDQHGAPIATATITITNTGCEVVSATSADDRGAYAVSGLAPGTVIVTAGAPGQRPAAHSVGIGDQPTVQHDLRLAPFGRILGSASASTHGPVADAPVTLTDAAGVPITSAITAADGSYELTDVPPGEYTLLATGYPAVSARVVLDEAENSIRHNVEFTPRELEQRGDGRP